MPSRRLERTREEKVEEILDAAEVRVRVEGFDGLSVAAIARELGVAQNAVYWYFPSKDALYVATLRRMLAATVEARPPAVNGVAGQVIWFVDELQALHAQRAALAERARTSPLAAEFIAELNNGLRGMLANALAAELPEAELSVAVDTFVATVEGCVLQQLPTEERHRLLLYALDRLVAAPVH